MNVREFIKNLQAIVYENPDFGYYPVVLSTDVEGGETQSIGEKFHTTLWAGYKDGEVLKLYDENADIDRLDEAERRTVRPVFSIYMSKPAVAIEQ